MQFTSLLLRSAFLFSILILISDVHVGCPFVIVECSQIESKSVVYHHHNEPIASHNLNQKSNSRTISKDAHNNNQASSSSRATTTATPNRVENVVASHEKTSATKGSVASAASSSSNDKQSKSSDPSNIQRRSASESQGPKITFSDTLISNPNLLWTASNPKVYPIGGILSGEDAMNQFRQIIDDINYKPDIVPMGSTLLAATMQMTTHPVNNALHLCQNLISKKVYAVIVSQPQEGEVDPISVIYTCGLYRIPVIGISARDSYFSDKYTFPSFIRTVPPWSHQSYVWIKLLKALDYDTVIFIHSADIDGRMAYNNLEYEAQQHHIEIEAVIEYEPGFVDIDSELQEVLHEISCRVFVLYAGRKEDAEAIFSELQRLNMTGAGFVWLISEQAMYAYNVPQGALALRLLNSNPSDEITHVKDAVYVIAKALKDLHAGSNITQPPSTCGDMHNMKWLPTGEDLFMSMIRQQFINTDTGHHIAFDDRGDRLDAEYEIINILGGQPVPVGSYEFDETGMRLNLLANRIKWPGNPKAKPLGFHVPTHLRVATIEEKPFIWVKAPLSEVSGACEAWQVPCTRHNSSTRKIEKFCCEGYCMDLLKEISSKLNLTYELHIVEDQRYGALEWPEPGASQKIWTGLVGELVYNKADMVVAPLTINPERSLVIDFTKPFKYQGITIIERKHPKSNTIASFMQPFQNTLWVLVMVSVHVVALALYLLDRFSPFGRYKLPNSDITEEDALNLSSAIWFAWGVLLNSGIGEGTPRSFSARVLGMVWAGFAMIIVASYTANLAAFLVLDRPESGLSGINDARLRNPYEGFTFATVKGSAVEMYFKRQIELSDMLRAMGNLSYPSVNEAIAAVKSGDLNAFIWDSSRLEFEAAQDCDLVTAAELFGRSGYGIAFQKGSYYTDLVTLKLLELHESGFMESLDNKWILGPAADAPECEDLDESGLPSTLGLKNMAGVFILVIAGILGGIGLIFIEIIYKKRQTKRQRQMEIVRNVLEKWKGHVVRKRSWRQALQQQAYYRQLQRAREREREARERQEQMNIRDQERLLRVRQIQQTRTQSEPRACYDQGQASQDSFVVQQQPSLDSNTSIPPPAPYTVERGMNEIRGRRGPRPQLTHQLSIAGGSDGESRMSTPDESYASRNRDHVVYHPMPQSNQSGSSHQRYTPSPVQSHYYQQQQPPRHRPSGQHYYQYRTNSGSHEGQSQTHHQRPHQQQYFQGSGYPI